MDEVAATAWAGAVKMAARSKDRRGLVSALVFHEGQSYRVEVAAMYVEPDNYDHRAKIPSPYNVATRWQLVVRLDLEGAARTKSPTDDTAILGVLSQVQAAITVLFEPGQVPGLKATFARTKAQLAYETWRGGDVGGATWVVRKGRWVSLHSALIQW